MATITVKIEIPKGATMKDVEAMMESLAIMIQGQAHYADYRDEATFVIRQPAQIAIH